MKTKLSFIFGLIILINHNCYGAFPISLQLCKIEDVQCISRTITDLLNKNPNGRPDMNVPNLEPLKVNQLLIKENSGGAVKFDLTFSNLDIYGLSKLKVDRAVGFSRDPATSKFELYATVPKLHLKGNYKANGRILILPIEGTGPSDIVLERNKISVKFKPTIINKNGKKYIGIDKLKILLEPDNMKIQLNNLFNGDKTLGDNMNTFLNENWKDVWTELGPSINSGISEVIKVIAANIFKLSAYEDIYSKD